MDKLSTFISTVGFPIFVALILLVRYDAMHREMLAAIVALKRAVESLDACLVDRIERLSRGKR